MNDQQSKREYLFRVTFEARVRVSEEEVAQTRANNRNFLSSGLFRKDINIAQVIAHNKAMEAISRQDADVITDIEFINNPDINFNVDAD